MKFTVSWLKQFVEVNLTPQELGHRLTMAGLEVDAVEPLFEGLAGVKVAEILAVSPHPDADRLVLCQVAVGAERMQVVCGAPNARAGMFTVIALPGAALPSGMVIKQSKIRGQLSQGMLCSEKDLSISDNHHGIIELDWLHESGGDVAEVLQLRDTAIEVDLTPNRPDCASVLGIAREAGAFCGTSPRPPLTDRDLPLLTGATSEFSVKVEHDDCPRYAGRLLKGVTVGPSPWWLKRRLLSVGLRPINNVVDVTNYVMLEYGQPLHAFDFGKLAGGAIVVRQARAGETLTTLDGVERALAPEMLMICDAEKPVAVAGVMGGANSEVDGATREVLLEAACFNPVSVRRTARRLGLATDASYRFERGVDPQLPPLAMERAVRLICEVSGARVVDNGFDLAAGVKANQPIRLRVKRAADLLGRAFTAAEISARLSAIEIAVTQLDADTLEVVPPSFRVDLEREVDLIEEIARLTGYNEFPLTMPLVPMAVLNEEPARKLRKDVAAVMIALGFHEAINYSFVNPAHYDMLGLGADDPRRRTVPLLNPLADDQSVLRTLLLPGLLENVRHNLSYQVTDLRLFETGKCFVPAAAAMAQPAENTMLTAVLSGRRLPGSPLLHTGEAKCDIYDVKGAAEILLARLGIAGATFSPAPSDAEVYGEPDTYCRISAPPDQIIGSFARVAKKVLAQFGIKQEVYYLTVDLDALLTVARRTKQFVTLPKFPAVKWDIAVVVPERVGAGEIVQMIVTSGLPLIEQAELFDVFRGGAIPQGMKSVAIAVTYRSAEQTLDDETVGRQHQKIIDMIVKRFDAQLREE